MAIIRIPTISGGLSFGDISLDSSTPPAGFKTTHVAGLDIHYQPGDLDSRLVKITGVTITIGPGPKQSMDIDGIPVNSTNGQLWVNGQQVDLGGAGAAAPSSTGELEKLQVRYPGVEFSGNAAAAFIDSKATIAKGAHLELSANLAIYGESIIESTARITGGEISSSHIWGEVSGGDIVDSNVAEGALVTDGKVKRSQLQAGSTVNGGDVRGCVLEGARVDAGILRDMNLEAGSRVTGGTLTGFTLAKGEVVSGGTHEGALTQSGASPVLVSGATISGGLVIGNVSEGDITQVTVNGLNAGLRSGTFDQDATEQMQDFSAAISSILDALKKNPTLDPNEKARVDALAAAVKALPASQTAGKSANDILVAATQKLIDDEEGVGSIGPG